MVDMERSAVRNPTYVVQGTTTAGQTGSFQLNYTDSNTSYGASSEIFYIFCNPLTADRNTVYIGSHGITGNQDVDITVDSTRYSAGDRFGYTNTTTGTTDMPASFQQLQLQLMMISLDYQLNNRQIQMILREFLQTLAYHM